MKKINIILLLSCLVMTFETHAQLNRKTLVLLKKPSTINDTTTAIADSSILKVAERVGDNLGKWSPVYDWPVAAVHMSLLPNGKVLVWDDTQDDGIGIFNSPGPFHTSVWDPATNSHNAVPIAQRNPTNQDMFCASHVQLPNGDVFTSTGPPPILSYVTQVYNWRTDKWYQVANLNYPRYYPSVAALANGNIMVLGGNYYNDVIPLNTELDKAEVYANNRWTVLSNTQMDFSSEKRGTIDNTSFYPWIQQAPNGQVFYAGPESRLRYISTLKDGSVSNVGSRDQLFRDYGSYAMYDIGKILVAGGGNSYSPTTTIDINGGTPIISAAGNLNYGRRQGNLTILADGSVLMTGGNSSGSIIGNQFDLNGSAKAVELWNAQTNTWVALSSMQKSRQYHSTSILIPDGRVINGGGICSPCFSAGQNNIDAEYYSPPYLFKPDGTNAPRPSITQNPSYLTYDSTFKMAITLPPATTLKKIHIIKLGSVTHATNFDQRLVPLNFSGTPENLTVQAPLNGNIATPGFYMLIVVNSAGAPSVAKIVQVGNGGNYPVLEERPNGIANQAIIVQEDGNALLTWKYPSDEKLKQFEIEKQENDGQYKTIHVESAFHSQNNEILEYKFKDFETTEGQNNYRIKVMSIEDKKPIYFDNLSLLLTSDKDFIVSPNPAKNFVNVNLSCIKGEKATISLVDVAGQVKFKEQIQANPAINRIELKDFEVGQYFMRIETEGRKPVIKRFTVVK